MLKLRLCGYDPDNWKNYETFKFAKNLSLRFGVYENYLEKSKQNDVCYTLKRDKSAAIFLNYVAKFCCEKKSYHFKDEKVVFSARLRKKLCGKLLVCKCQFMLHSKIVTIFEFCETKKFFKRL